MKTGPQLIIASKLLRVAGTDLEQVVLHELADNPALELVGHGESLDRDQGSLSSSNGTLTESSEVPYDRPMAAKAGSGREFDYAAEQVPAHPSAIEQLIAQVRLMVDGPDLDVAVYLLYSLDDHGYLRTSPEALAAEIDVPLAAIERVIRILHHLEPPGIGARNIHECFLIQCAHLESEGINCRVVSRILNEAWGDFVNRRWDRVAQKLRMPEITVEDAWQFVYLNLYPYPLLMVEDSPPSYEALHYADLIIHREAHRGRSVYTLEIRGATALELRVSGCFESALRPEGGGECELSRTEKDWISTYVDSARLFIAALNQRWDTLRRIGEYLINYQVEFLDHGPLHLKPLTRAVVAKDLDLHESTVSRAVNEKTVQLPDGQLMPLSGFFDNTLAPKEAIRQLLTGTSTPLSDREIADHLRAEGLELARRTVTKYRQQLNIPPSHRRQYNSALSSAQRG